MNKDIDTSAKRSSDSRLTLVLCILLVVAILAALTVVVIYAKYVTLNNSTGTANVAGVGVEVFNLVQNGQAIAGIDYSKVIPGADIPGPHIRLKINSEVSYTLYIDVKVSNLPTFINDEGKEVQAVSFQVTDSWELVQKTVTDDSFTVYTYKYIVDEASNEKNYVFKAGVEYSYVDDNEIKILQDDVIYVSDRYSQDMAFYLKFEARIQQVL